MEIPIHERRVIVLNQFAKPRDGAGGTRHAELFSRLTGWRYQIIVGHQRSQGPNGQPTSDPNFLVVRGSAYDGTSRRRVMGWLSYSASAFAAAMRGRRPGVVYASSPHILTPIVGWAVARIRRASLVVEIRDLWPQSLVDLGHVREGTLLHRLLLSLELWIYRHADHIIVVTDGWHDYLADRGIERERITTVSNGAEPDDFKINRSVRPLRDRVPVSGRLFVFAGSHGVKDGLDTVLTTAMALPEHTFVLIGDGPHKASLIKRAKIEVIRNVCFLEAIPKDELSGLLGGADFGLHVVADIPVFRLGMSPNKLYDYLAAGLPVLTNAEGEPRRIVEKARAGIGVPSAELADGCSRLARLGEDELNLMRANAVDYVRNNKSRVIMAARLQGVLDELLLQNSPCSPSIDR